MPLWIITSYIKTLSCHHFPSFIPLGFIEFLLYDSHWATDILVIKLFNLIAKCDFIECYEKWDFSMNLFKIQYK